jgi:hypothetical protein
MPAAIVDGEFERVAGALDLGTVALRPHRGLGHRLEQRSSEGREGVVDARRNRWINGALHESVPLEAAQREGQHALRDAPIDRFRSLKRFVPSGLTVLAALGCAVLQACAIVFHVSRGEAARTPFNFVLVGLSVFVDWGRRSKAPIQPRV